MRCCFPFFNVFFVCVTVLNMLYMSLDEAFLSAAPFMFGAGHVREEHHGARAPDLLLKSFLEAFLKTTMLSLLILVRPFRPSGGSGGALNWRFSEGITAENCLLLPFTIHVSCPLSVKAAFRVSLFSGKTVSPQF